MLLALPELATVFVLVFARVGTLVMLLPGIGERLIPGRLRLAFALLLTLTLFPLARGLLPAETGPERVFGILFGEILVGLVLGLATRIVIGALQTAGTIIAQELGLSFAMTIDPSQGGGQEAAIGNLLTLLGIALVFATDTHHIAITAIRDSYALLPPAAGAPEAGDAARLAVGAVGRAFALAVKISAPFIAFAFLFNLGLGILSRLMPQVQVFFLGIPLSILIGMLVLTAVVGAMMAAFVQDLGRFMTGFGSL
jgi:flagellar biosynthetic protein FliR